MTEQDKSVHTAGPWVVEANDGAYVKERGLAEWRIEERSTPAEMVVALVVTDVSPLKERAEANARLIAAAPELLEACNPIMLELAADQCARSGLASVATALRLMVADQRAAIAKVTGADQ